MSYSYNNNSYKIINSRKYKSILFDLDGTLTYYNPTNYYAVKKVHEELGLDFNDDIYDEFLKKEIIYWQNTEGKDTTDDLQGLNRIDYIRAKLYMVLFPELKISLDDAIKLMNIYIDNLGIVNQKVEYSEEILKYLYDKYKLYIVSNGPGSAQRRKLERTGLIDYFEGIVTTDDALCEKPRKEFFQFLFDRYDVSPKETILIGDSITSDILGAKNAGLESIWFNNRKEKENNTSIIPEYEINKLRDLKKIL